MDNNKKLINLANLAKLSKSLDDRCKDSVNEVKSSVDEAKAEFVSEIARVEAMLGGRSIRYVTQDEYDALSPAEKNSDTVVYFVTDDMGDDGAHDHDDLYFTKEEIEALLAALPDNDHTHDEYYTKTTMDSMLSNKSDKDHEHSDYATKDEVEALGNNVDTELAKKANKSEIPSLENYYNKNDVDGIKTNIESTIAGEVAALTAVIGGKADEGHNHNTLYHTKEYINANFYTKNDIDGTVGEINANKADIAELANYFTKTEVNGIKDDILEDINDLQEELDNTKTELTNHKHNDDYYTKSQIDTAITDISVHLLQLAPKEHDHDDVYATKDEIEALESNYDLQLNNKADKSELSRFDNYYDKTQVDGFVSNLESSIQTEIATLDAAIGTAQTNAVNSAKSYTDTAIANLVDSAPEAMNTLGELAKSISDHQTVYEGYVATVSANIATAKSEAISEAASKDAALKTELQTKINTDVKAEADRAKAAEEGLQAKFDSLDTSFENHNHDGRYYTESEIDTKIAGINTTIETQVATLTGNIATAKSEAITEAGKLDATLKTQLQAEIDADVAVEKLRAENKETELQGGITTLESNVTKINESIASINESLKTVDALTLNGYSIWVGTTEELEAIETRDPSTLYFEIGESGDEVVQVNVTNGVLQLTTDKYQKTTMVSGARIVFPTVNKFTEIHLYFDAETDMDLSLPDNCRWRVDPNIEAGKSYEIVATYNTIHWLVNVIVYS